VSTSLYQINKNQLCTIPYIYCENNYS